MCPPTGGPLGETVAEKGSVIESKPKETKTMIKVGKKVLDFFAPAYLNSKFVNVNLSEYLGK